MAVCTETTSVCEKNISSDNDCQTCTHDDCPTAKGTSCDAQEDNQTRAEQPDTDAEAWYAEQPSPEDDTNVTYVGRNTNAASDSHMTDLSNLWDRFKKQRSFWNERRYDC